MSGEELRIEREDDGTAGRYVVRLGPDAEGELTYRRSASNTLVVDHTFTPPEFRGRNIAASLVERLIADARAEGTRIVPVCPYVAVQFRRHPEWSDLLAAP